MVGPCQVYLSKKLLCTTDLVYRGFIGRRENSEGVGKG